MKMSAENVNPIDRGWPQPPDHRLFARRTRPTRPAAYRSVPVTDTVVPALAWGQGARKDGGT
jgi:hypothetical protein